MRPGSPRRVLATDPARESTRAARPLGTRERDAAVRRIVRAVGIVSDLGALEFADDETRRREFKALVSRSVGSGKPDAPEQSEPPEEAPASQ